MRSATRARSTRCSRSSIAARRSCARNPCFSARGSMRRSRGYSRTGSRSTGATGVPKRVRRRRAAPEGEMQPSYSATMLAATLRGRRMQDPSEFVTPLDPVIERRLERLGLNGRDGAWDDRYLVCEHILDPPLAPARQKFEAIARFSRDLIAQRWVKTRQARERDNPKRVYYLSMEYLIGRTLNNNLVNMAAHPMVEAALKREGWNLDEILEQEPDAGL